MKLINIFYVFAAITYENMPAQSSTTFHDMKLNLLLYIIRWEICAVIKT
jgi:hypothetical protein